TVSWTDYVFLLLPSVVSAISVIVIAILIHAIKRNKCDYCHNKDTLVPVTTVPLGESVTFTCALPTTEFGSKQLYWFKQNAGETLTLIVTLLGSTKPEFAPETSDSRLEVKRDNKLSTLTIRTTIPEDEGMYHCLSTESYGNPVWSGTYLLLKASLGNLQTYNIYLLCGISAISLIVISVLIHAIKKSKCECDHNKAAVSLQDCVANMNAKRNDDQWIYSTVIYNVMKTSIGGTRDKKASRERGSTLPPRHFEMLAF
ncbi:hypothetical protein KUCAC02_004529, partial [Chaenocephalus aceratus]